MQTAKTTENHQQPVAFPQVPNFGFLRLRQVLSVIQVGRSKWWAGVKDGRFPKPVKLGPRTTAWRVEDILELIEGADAK